MFYQTIFFSHLSGWRCAHDVGLCTDVVIRYYRILDLDLKKLVHTDMKVIFNTYPSRSIWGLKRPDPNIDHRRAPNLQVFFPRKVRPYRSSII
ncbi:MAG: DUF1287 domain-containing protein [Candidatus Thiodiazotropha sp. L084R]